MSFPACLLPVISSASILPSGGMCFEEDYELEDWENEEEPEPPVPPTDPPADPPPIDPPGGDQLKGMQAALAAERKKRQEYEAQLATFQAAQREAEEAAAKKRGEFETLYTTAKQERDALEAKVKAFEEAEATRLADLTAANDAAMKALPKNFRALVPENLSPGDKAAQIARLQATLADATPTGGIPPKAPPKTDVIPSQYVAATNTEAARYKMDPLQYWKVRMRPRLIKEGKIKA